jgi:uncharacterized membrane protein YfcA
MDLSIPGAGWLIQWGYLYIIRIMVKTVRGLHFCLLLVLLPCVLFLAEFTRDVKEIRPASSVVSNPDIPVSGLGDLFVSDALGQTPLQNRTHRLWRQCLSLVAFALFLGAVYGLRVQKRLPLDYCKKLFHILVVSLFLGGRAPPLFAY